MALSNLGPGACLHVGKGLLQMSVVSMRKGQREYYFPHDLGNRVRILQANTIDGIKMGREVPKALGLEKKKQTVLLYT